MTDAVDREVDALQIFYIKNEQQFLLRANSSWYLGVFRCFIFNCLVPGHLIGVKPELLEPNHGHDLPLQELRWY